MTVQPFPAPAWLDLEEKDRVSVALAAMARVKIPRPRPGVPWDVYNLGVRCGPAGRFDDLQGQVWTDDAGVIHAWFARGTTDPGVSGIYSPKHPGGTAAVSRGWHPRVWTRGVYRGGSGKGPPRPALLQAGTMRVDRQPIPGAPHLASVPIVAGHPGYGSGVHLHWMGGGDDGRLVGAWSLGCQGYEDEADHLAAMERCDRQNEAHPGWGNRFGFGLMLLSDLFPVAVG